MKQDLELRSPPGAEKPEEGQATSAGVQNPGDQDVGPERKAWPRERRGRSGVFLNSNEPDADPLSWGGFRVPGKGDRKQRPNGGQEGTLRDLELD